LTTYEGSVDFAVEADPSAASTATCTAACNRVEVFVF